MTEATIRLGVIGLGRAFTLMLPTFLADRRVRLVAACDPRPMAQRQFERDFGAPIHANVEALAADPNVDAVYIASPHQFHAEQTRIVAAHGKHVLVEKPMALSLAECDAMIEATEAAGVHLIVGHSHSFDTPYLKARELIASGEFGPVRMIHALNYTDFLYRPRRPEELKTEEGGGVVFSQAAHQIEVVRLLAGSRATRVRAVAGAWDAARPTEGAYSALMWFEAGAHASLNYSGYAHFDSDEWCDGIGEMGAVKRIEGHGEARRRLATLAYPAEEARLKNDATYGGPSYRPPAPPAPGEAPRQHQHFGAIVVSCERADIRPLPGGLMIDGDARRERRPIELPVVPRFEVIDELETAVVDGRRPAHDGRWAKATLEVCIALLRSSRDEADVRLEHQVAWPR